MRRKNKGVRVRSKKWEWSRSEAPGADAISPNHHKDQRKRSHQREVPSAQRLGRRLRRWSASGVSASILSISPRPSASWWASQTLMPTLKRLDRVLGLFHNVSASQIRLISALGRPGQRLDQRLGRWWQRQVGFKLNFHICEVLFNPKP